MDPVHFYRVSHRLYGRGARGVPRLINALTFLLFNAVIPYQLEAGRNFRVGHHGLGVVIHPSTRLGDDVFLNHGVTLATDLPPDDPRRMILGSRITIGTGAILVGPIEIGDDVVIGAGAVVLGNVRSGMVVAGVPARVVSENGRSRQHSLMGKPASKQR
jgi:serine O-acetyltransferase